LIAAQPDRVSVWASQLAANNFPPVCAMSGKPAETWRRFNFSTAPQWAYGLLALIVFGGIGIIAYAIVVSLVSQKASGYLPLTKASSNRLNVYLWTIGALLPLSFVLMIGGLVIASGTDSTSGAIGAAVVVSGALMFAAFVVGALLRTLFRPGATVHEPAAGQYDKIVELKRVHPAFVAAVVNQHASWMAKSTQSN
jgi:hypothetical protein